MKKIFYILSIAILLFSCNEHKVTSIDILGSKNRVMNIGDKDTIEVIIQPLSSYYYNTIYWRTSDPNVASVDNNGVVTAVYSGTCTITATAGNKTATCEITVNTFELNDLEFTQAVVYFYGNESGIAGINTAVLRLYSAGYNIEIDGSISGSGYLFHSQINYPEPNLLPPNGTFTNSETTQNFTFLPGKLNTADNTVSGTFLYFSNIGGASAILINTGSLNIANNLITGNFIGESGEKIKISYSGDIQFIDRTLPPPDTLKLENSVQSYAIIGDVFGNGTSVRRCIIYSEDLSGAYLQLDFVVPLSASSIPIGFYRMNNSHQAYSLVESDLSNETGTILFENSTTLKEILYGNVNVEAVEGRLKLTIHLVEDNGRVIFGKIGN